MTFNACKVKKTDGATGVVVSLCGPPCDELGTCLGFGLRVFLCPSVSWERLQLSCQPEISGDGQWKDGKDGWNHRVVV